MHEVELNSRNQWKLNQLLKKAPSRRGVQLRYTERAELDESARCFVLETAEGKWLGAITLSTVNPTYFHTEMILRHPDAPVGVGAVAKLAETGHTALERAGLGSEDIDWLVPHQANLRIIRSTAQKIKLPMEKVILTVQDHGNTSAASIPLALSYGVESNKIKPGNLLLMEAIGGGLAWGAAALRW